MAESEVAAIVKVVARVVDVDALSGQVNLDAGLLTISPADHAAVAVASALAESRGESLVIYSVVAPRGEAALAQLAAAGSARVVRIALAGDDALEPANWLGAFPSATVAHALSTQLTHASFIVAGDHSLDRGSATVPARLAQRLSRPQALGLLDVDVATLTATRRLSGGWRERLHLDDGAVISVEAGAGRLGRATPMALRDTRVATRSVPLTVAGLEGAPAPYRAPVDVVSAPSEPHAARRAMEVIGALSAHRRHEVLELSPRRAAETILECLTTWEHE